MVSTVTKGRSSQNLNAWLSNQPGVRILSLDARAC